MPLLVLCVICHSLTCYCLNLDVHILLAFHQVTDAIYWSQSATVFQHLNANYN